MKRQGWMTRDSYACQIEDAYRHYTHKVCGYITDQDARETGVRWHHGAGHSRGRGVYYFWANTPEDEKAIEALRELARRRAEERKKRRFPSKAAAWRHIEATRRDREADRGHGSILVRLGKYGLSLNYGDVQYEYYFADAQKAHDIKEALEIC